MRTREENQQHILNQKLLPLFYHGDIEVCKATTEALYDGGARCLEFTNRGEHALTNFTQLILWRNETFPDLQISVGTVKNSRDATDFIAAGADVLISPFYDKGVSEVAKKNNILWVPGCMTVTEIHMAEEDGCRLIKLFPGNVLTIGFVEAIKPLFPSVNFVVTGGVDTSEENINKWLQAGAKGVGLGSKLITSDVLEKGNFAALKELTAKVVSILQK